MWIFLILTLAAFALGVIIEMGLIKDEKVKRVAEVSKVAIEQFNRALADGKITKEEFFDAVQVILDKLRE